MPDDFTQQLFTTSKREKIKKNSSKFCKDKRTPQLNMKMPRLNFCILRLTKKHHRLFLCQNY